MRLDLIGPKGPWLLARAPWTFHLFTPAQILRDFAPANDVRQRVVADRGQHVR
jgi:hypothetical protein